MSRLNYHHLYYFWQVALSGNLTQTAQQLHISQSALSTQIKQLEDSLNQPLFFRQGRKLILTEAGQQVLGYATDIFSKGEELEALMRRGISPQQQQLRIGTAATMSRNFIEAFISPLLENPDQRFSLQSLPMPALLDGLANHEIDLALTNTNVGSDPKRPWQVQRVASQPLSVIGPPALKPETDFPRGYDRLRWLLPGARSEMRQGFAAFCSLWQFTPNIQAEVDDMAMLRLLARDSGGVAVMPSVVVRDELANGKLAVYFAIPDVFEHFYAITAQKRIQPDALRVLLDQQKRQLY